MKKTPIFFLILLFLLSLSLPVSAQEGKVTYNGSAKEFIFEPGGLHSPTDLFPNYKGVMPGDILTQKITVKNDAAENVKVKIYMRSLGAHENSVDFLSKLGLKVEKSKENDMAYMFDAAASETAQLTDWVCLGTLYSGGEVNLDVLLSVPVELDNQYSDQIGYLDWEFMIEEFPVEEGDPQAPQTGDGSKIELWFAALFGSAAILIFLLFIGRKKQPKEETENTQH